VTTAFVFSGGGSLGAIQAGMLLALAERGVVPDLLVGTSVGAVNAAWAAERPGVDGARELTEVWRSVRREQVFPLHPIRGLLGLTARRDHLVDPGSFRALLARHLNFDRLEEAAVPLLVVATDVATGSEVVLSQGDTVDAVAASTAIPGVFPPVPWGDGVLIDGGVSNNAPISHAVESGAEIVYVLPTGYACSLDRPPASALGVVLHSITLLVQQRLAAEVARGWEGVSVRVVPPLCPLAVSPVDFGRSAELIEAAHAATTAWLERDLHGGPEQAALLLPHEH
jgi:NTE family protein